MCVVCGHHSFIYPITINIFNTPNAVKQFNYLGWELCLDAEPDFEKK